MRARATQVQPLDGRAVAAPTRYGTHEQNLVESELSVVEALLGHLELHLVRPNLQYLGDALCERVLRSRRHVLDVQLEAVAVRALHPDVPGRGSSAVVCVVVGPLQGFAGGGGAVGRGKL